MRLLSRLQLVADIPDGPYAMKGEVSFRDLRTIKGRSAGLVIILRRVSKLQKALADVMTKISKERSISGMARRLFSSPKTRTSLAKSSVPHRGQLTAYLSE
jgi:hypothetical protein